MAVTPIDPPVGALDSVTKVVRFSVDNLVGLVIGIDHSDSAVARPVEFIYADGVFLYPYLGSTLVGNVFSIQRQGGWSYHEINKVRVFEQSPYGKADGALTPTLYGPLAQWALRGAPDTATTYADRSGNARHITSGTPVPVPSRIPGFTGITGKNPGLKLSGAGLRLLGEMTVTCKAWAVASAGVQVIIDCSKSGTGSANNTLFTVGISANAPFLYRETGSGVGVGTGMSSTVTPGRWTWLSWRRAASGDVTYGIDLTYQTVTMTPATDGSAADITIGTDNEPGQPWLGGFEDLSIWGARLTDAQLLSLYTVAMGV